MNIGIVGHGFVGKAVEYGLCKCSTGGNIALICDKYKSFSKSLQHVVSNSDIIFMCLPTPFDEATMSIDLSIYDNVIDEVCSLPFSKGKTIVIKSTVTPGTTQGYAEKYPDVNWVFNPEFLTESNYLSDFVKTERIVIGLEAGALLDTRNLMKDLYMSIPYFTTTPMLFMTATEAEIVKYQSNILLATKIAVSNVIYDLCQKMVCADYERVKSGVSLDNRIGDSHLDITEERGFGGKCFAKDLGAFIGKCKDMGVDADLLEEVFNYNCRIRKVHDWNEIPGATKEGKQYDEV